MSTASPTSTAPPARRTASGWMIGSCAVSTTRRAGWRSRRPPPRTASRCSAIRQLW
uniref:NAC030 n=1 Tax=Arundo donax TaxID=35708 RepID=A0A0A9FKA2_ARUDO